jgi:hypothetical protein
MRYLTLRSVVPFVAVVACACSSSSASSPSASPSPTRDSGVPAASGDASGSGEASSPVDAASDACPTYSDAGAPHAIIGNLAFVAGSMGVGFGTQNGSTVNLAASSIVGKTLVWATVPGGEQIANVAMPTEFGTTTIASDLTAHFQTSSKYADGPWELVVYISITGGDITMGPQSGDLAAFDLTKPPACEPPVTGVSIRVTIDGADATVDLTNSSFIRF